MSLHHEKARALIAARDFLRDLLNPQKTPKVPTKIREQAYWVLRHYPAPFDIAVRGDLDKTGLYIPIEQTLNDQA